jgi:TrmH family RNA methyltransferase
VFRLPWVGLVVDDLLAWVEKEHVTLWTAAVGGEPVSEAAPTLPLAIVLGNEGAGLSPALRQAGRPVAIPMSSGTESLNVAVAAGILLYEVTRAR